ncbi:MAG: hypothetical protein PHU71_05975 [Candidatus Gracilibacteria bacterium]|nr:hypothetical protein [Candidatus Gracilibacteria bacterium]
MKHLARIGTLTDKQYTAFAVRHILCNSGEDVDNTVKIEFVRQQIDFIRQEIKQLALESSREVNLSQLRTERVSATRELAVLKKSPEKRAQIKEVCLRILAIDQVFIARVRSSKRTSLKTVREAEKIDHVLNDDPNDEDYYIPEHAA